MHMPNYFWIFIVGQATSGIAQGFIYIPLLPEIIDAVQLKEGIIEGQN